jgi:hypothetical protein
MILECHNICKILKNILAYVPVARQQTLINATVGHKNRKTVFYMWSMPRCYRQGTRLVVTEFCMGGCEERTGAREAEESSLLEAVVRERMVKAQQAGKCLASVVVI